MCFTGLLFQCVHIQVIDFGVRIVKIWLDLGLMRLFIIVLEQPYYNKVFCDNMTKERDC